MNRRPHVLVVVENLSVPFDRRVWQESTALVRAGCEVTVVCPRGTKRDTAAEAVIDGVRILRYPLDAATGGPLGYVPEYAVALWWTLRLSLRAARSRRVDVVHVCNPPDFLFLAVLPLVLRGARMVFDHHDLVPELYESRFPSSPEVLKLPLFAAERMTFSLADGVIATNESYREVAVRRGGIDPSRTTVVRSAPETGRFPVVEPDPALRGGREHLVVYLGVMGPQDGVDYALRAMAALVAGGRTDFRGLFMGSGDVYDDLVRLRDELGLTDVIEMPGRVSDEFVATAFATASVAVAPDPLNPLNDLSTMNKIIEYMAFGLPVVSFDLKEARVSAGDAAAYAVANDVRAFAAIIDELMDDPVRRREMGAEGRRRATGPLSWRHSEQRLVAFYRDVIGLPLSAS